MFNVFPVMGLNPTRNYYLSVSLTVNGKREINYAGSSGLEKATCYDFYLALCYLHLNYLFQSCLDNIIDFPNNILYA